MAYVEVRCRQQGTESVFRKDRDVAKDVSVYLEVRAGALQISFGGYHEDGFCINISPEIFAHWVKQGTNEIVNVGTDDTYCGPGLKQLWCSILSRYLRESHELISKVQS